MLLVSTLLIGALAGCEPKVEVRQKIEKSGLKTVYVVKHNITPRTEKRIAENALVSINAFRKMHGRAPVIYHDTLSLVAKEHALDIMQQGRAWHFGSDGSSPIDRTRRAGYAGIFLGEAISETFEGEEKTVFEWLKNASARNAILSKDALHIGLGYVQEEMGKIWWVVVLGGPGQAQPVSITPEFTSLNEYLALSDEEKEAYEKRVRGLDLGDSEISRTPTDP